MRFTLVNAAPTLALALALPAFAQNALDPMGWDLIGATAAETQFTKPAERQGGAVRRWVRSEGSQSRTYGSFTFISMTSLVEFDCEAGRSRSSDATLFSRNNISGDILRLPAMGAWRKVNPDSLSFKAMERACAEEKAR